MSQHQSEVDVAVIGGGPAGATIGCLLGMRGYRVLVLEADVYPRHHVGESITASANPIFERIGFLDKIEDAGFVHRPGACWTAPRAPAGTFVLLRLDEFPPPGETKLYAYNVERDVFDTMLLRHAHEHGAQVLQGARVDSLLLEGDRATGVRVTLADGWQRDVSARYVVDASGASRLIPTQLGLKKRKDPAIDQFCVSSWFRDVEPNPAGHEGMLYRHFLDLERSWAWQIPLRNGITSVGVVTDRQDFQSSGRSAEEFFTSLTQLNRSLEHAMRQAIRIRPWWTEADFSQEAEQPVGPGWLLIGDAVRFVDPVFCTGVDAALHSAVFAFEAIEVVLKGEQDERTAFSEYARRVGEGVQAWYDLITIFYQLRNLFTAYAVRRRFREQVVRILEGNPYLQESRDRAREMIALMEQSYDKIVADPNNLLRPGVMFELATQHDDADSDAQSKS